VLLLALALCAGSFSAIASAAESKLTRDEVYKAAQKTIDYYQKSYRQQEYKGILDWPALGLFGFGEDVSGPEWTVNGKNGAYWREQEVRQGVGLSKTKNTDFQRTIIGVCAAGQDPRNFGGLNLVEIEKGTMLPNGHFADSVADRKTGLPVGDDLINAHVFGVISLHCAGEPIPNRDKCLEWLAGQQHRDGGFTWDVKYFDDPKDYELVESDVDMTAAALMAFAILGETETNPVVARAIDFLKKKQLDNGGFYSWGTENPESCAWVIQALTLLGKDPMGPEWTKPSGGNPVSALLRFQLPNGSFTHVLSEDDNLPIYDNGMSTYQALYALADAYNKKASYDLLHEKYSSGYAENIGLAKDDRAGELDEILTVKLTIGSTDAVVNSRTVSMDVPPAVIDGRTVVPVRFVAENMGAKVDWQGDTQTVQITLDGKEISLVIGQARPEEGLDVPAQIVNGRTLVPLRYVSEAFGAEVKWLPDTQSVEIVKN
jgi:hypothetical protein